MAFSTTATRARHEGDMSRFGLDERQEAMRFLVISDDSVGLDLAAVILKRQGFKATVAVDLEEARSALEAEAFSAVLVDVRPTALRGMEILEGLWPVLQSEGEKLVLLADEGDEKVLSSEMAAAAAVLTRPFEGDALLRAVEPFAGPVEADTAH